MKFRQSNTWGPLIHLNLSDAVDDLAPLEPPPCFHNRESWLQYLKSAAANQNHRANQKVIVVDEDGRPRFNERLNYCADYTQAKSLEMLNRGRCDPYHPARIQTGLPAMVFCPLWHR